MINVFLKSVIIPTILLTTIPSYSAYPCPIDSCNPHNGCTEGCTIEYISGLAACNEQDSSVVETAAIRDASKNGYRLCRRNFFMQSKWTFKVEDENNQCQLRATAQISCYK